MEQDAKDKVLKALDNRREETVELLRQLIRTPSVTGEEKAIAELIANKLKGHGFENVEIDGMGNVICRISGSGGGPTLLYNGHMDTVPVGDRALWGVDPFGAEIIEGRIVGRGACDMKGSIAAMMMAADSIKKADIKLRGELILTMVVKEENGLQEGSKYTIEQDGLKADVVLIGEATNLNVCLGSHGGIVVDISVKGKSAHAAIPSAGVNAIVKTAKLIEAISGMKLPSHEFLGPATQAITNISCQPGVLNMIPSLCSISIDRRIIPGDSTKKTKAEFQAVIDELKGNDPEFDADVETKMRGAPTYISPDEPAIKVVQESAKYVMGKNPELSMYTFGTDASYFGFIAQIPTVGFGPGDGRNAHTVNDYVNMDDLITASKIYALFAMNLLS